MTQKSDTESLLNEENLSVDAGIRKVLAMGEMAAKLLNNPIYLKAYRQVMDRMMSDWLQTSPKEREKRESQWHAIQGLSQSASELGAMVQLAEQEKLKSNRVRAQERDNLDKQGFGL